MKKILVSILLIVVVFSFSACGEKITLDNIENVMTEDEYSTVGINGKLRKSEETKIIQEAMEFAKKFISKQLTRSYKEDLNTENEILIFSEEYKERNAETLNEDFEFINEFYKLYGITTEVQNVNFNHVVNIGGDAYVEAVAKVRLTECADIKVAEAIGYKDGVNSNIPCEFRIKMKYIDSEYYVYDYEIAKKDGYLLALTEYKNIEDKMHTFGVKDEDKVKDLIRKVAYAQNNRDYKVFKGDEDYQYLSESFKAELNKDRDDVAFTKAAYEKYKINTSFISLKIHSIVPSGDKYVVRLEIKTKLNECINNEVAKNLRYVNGIGSEAIIQYEYVVGPENGEYKVFSTKEL